jgi:hypothetical protein
MAEGWRRLRIAFIVFGALLLLPGACSLLFTPIALPFLAPLLERPDGEYTPLIFLWFSGFVLAAIGGWLLFKGSRL